MRINNNIQALNAYRQLNHNQGLVSKHLEKLSSGLRINRAADDAAGLAISEKMRSQIRGLNTAERNTMDAISLIQTAEGALNETHAILQRMRELSVQAANGTLETKDRESIQDEIDQLTAEIDRIAETTQFNAKKLLSGDAGAGMADLNLNMQIGANASETITITIGVMDANTLGIQNTDVSTTQTAASTAITAIDNAITKVSEQRSKLGAYQNRMEHTVTNLGVAAENLTAAESRIRDADMAKEMTDFTKNNIINQSATAMLAQANQLPQGILQLLK
jgi:flagellin